MKHKIDMDKKNKILIAACTEGNGHLTQAIAYKERLNTEDNEIVAAIVAKKKKGAPQYFQDEFNNIVYYNGFDFVFNKSGGVVVWKTIFKNILKLPLIMKSFLATVKYIKKQKPNKIINFYDPIIGLTALFCRDVRYVSVSHQFTMELPLYPKIKGFYIQKFVLKLLNFICSIRAQKVGLSYYDIHSNEFPIIPPLLRKSSYIKSSVQEPFILVYLINEEMLRDLFCEAKKFPLMKFECFSKLTKEYKNKPKNVKLNQLNAKLFQEKMKICSGVICSGGFETSSEAIYQNKPLLMVPCNNHFEQHANSNDAEMAELAVLSKYIDFSRMPRKVNHDLKWFNKIEKYYQAIN